MFALKRLLSLVAITLTVSAIGRVMGHSAWIPLVLIVAVWPLPFRCKVESDTLSVRWLWVSHKVTLDERTRCTLAPDPRRWVVRRQTVLQLVRPGHPQLVLFAPLAVLRALHAQVNLALRDREQRGVSSPA
jgi:hypothetical protein